MEKKTSFNANTSLVLGIISLVLAFVPFFKLIGLVTGIIGLVLSSENKEVEQSAKTGFILSLIGLIINGMKIVIFLFFIIFPFMLMV